MAIIHKDMTIDDIIAYCQEHGEIKWLKEQAAKKTERKVYPRVKGADGKKHVDKTQEPKIEYQPISFVEIKAAFMDKFAPDERVGDKNKKPTFHDKIANL